MKIEIIKIKVNTEIKIFKKLFSRSLPLNKKE